MGAQWGGDSGGWKGGRGSGGWKGGRGDMCVQLCKNTEQLVFVLEYNWPKMVAVIKRYMTLRQLIGKKSFCSYTVMYNVFFKYSGTSIPGDNTKNNFKLNWCFRLKVVGI